MRARLLTTLALLVICVSNRTHAQQASVQRPVTPAVRAGDLLITGGRLWDGVADTARSNPGLLIRNGSIMAVGVSAPAGAASGPNPDGSTSLVLPPDAFIMPGLFDLHAHYAVDLFGEGRIDEYTVNASLFLANGVTSTFPAGEVDPVEARSARERVARGEIPGPRIYSSGPYFGSWRTGWREAAITPDSLRKEATWWALQGVRGFKVKGISPRLLPVLIDVAHENGLTVTGHLDSNLRGVNPRDAILMGIDRVEHFLGGDAIDDTKSAYSSLDKLDLTNPTTRAQIDAQARLFIEHDTYFNATMAAYGYWTVREPGLYDDWANEREILTPFARGVVEAQLPRPPLPQFEKIHYVKKQTLKAFYDAGGAAQLTLGTDHPSWGEFWSGFGAHRELHAMVLAGLPPVAALRAGTINAARAIGVSERLGTIQTGKYADLYVVRGDPLTSITDSRRGLYVVRAGTVYRTSELLDAVRGRMGPADEADAEWWKGNIRLRSGPGR